MSSKGIRISETSQAEEQIGHESTYIRNTKESDSQKKKAGWWLPRAGGRGQGSVTHQVLSQSYKIQDQVLGTYSTMLCLQLTILGCALNTLLEDFPGGPVVKNPPAHTGDTGSIPGLGTKIPHAAGQLSLCSRARKPQLLKPSGPRGHAPQQEKPAHSSQRRAHAATKTLHSQKKKIDKNR